MRILHTADWHLGDRLGRLDRTSDLRRAVERVAEHCQRENVDVLLVAGDLFSELARADALREAIEHWQTQFGEFLARGGTILTLTGNHDNENFCQTLHRAMVLAAPLPQMVGALLPAGRLYLAAEPTLLRVADRGTDSAVQFILMPYPTPARYLRSEESRRYASIEEKNQNLNDAFLETLHGFRKLPEFEARLPVVLGAHVNIRGAQVGPSLFRMTENNDVLIDPASLGGGFAYVALGHIHKPQFLGGMTHVRYSGSIERMDLGERDDEKSVVIVDIGPEGMVSEPRLLPMPATAIYEVDIRNPTENMGLFKEQYAGSEHDLVNLHITYTAGVDNFEEVLRELETIFPRWYNRDWKEISMLGASLVDPDAGVGRNFEETVRSYVEQELRNHPDKDSKHLLELLDALLRGEPR